MADLTLFRLDAGGEWFVFYSERADDCWALYERDIGDPCESRETGDYELRELTHDEIGWMRVRDEDGQRLGPGSLWWTSQAQGKPHLVCGSPF